MIGSCVLFSLFPDNDKPSNSYEATPPPVVNPSEESVSPEIGIYLKGGEIVHCVEYEEKDGIIISTDRFGEKEFIALSEVELIKKSGNIVYTAPVVEKAEEKEEAALPEKTKPLPTMGGKKIVEEDTEKENDIVYRTSSGDKYHREGCRYLSESKIPISKEDAKKMGLTPCKVCNP